MYLYKLDVRVPYSNKEPVVKDLFTDFLKYMIKHLGATVVQIDHYRVQTYKEDYNKLKRMNHFVYYLLINPKHISDLEKEMNGGKFVESYTLRKVAYRI